MKPIFLECICRPRCIFRDIATARRHRVGVVSVHNRRKSNPSRLDVDGFEGNARHWMEVSVDYLRAVQLGVWEVEGLLALLTVYI